MARPLRDQWLIPSKMIGWSYMSDRHPAQEGSVYNRDVIGSQEAPGCMGFEGGSEMRVEKRRNVIERDALERLGASQYWSVGYMVFHLRAVTRFVKYRGRFVPSREGLPLTRTWDREASKKSYHTHWNPPTISLGTARLACEWVAQGDQTVVSGLQTDGGSILARRILGDHASDLDGLYQNCSVQLIRSSHQSRSSTF